MRNLARLVVLEVASLAAVAQQTDPIARSVILVNRFATAPKIDGKLDDACWSKATGKRQLFLSAAEGEALGQILDVQGLTARARTTFYVGFDDGSLYFAARCEEPMMDKLVARAAKRDGPAWKDDCVEFFFDVNNNRDTYWHIVINARGTVYDASCSYSAGKEDKSGNAQVRAAATKGSDYWSLEGAAPFATLGVGAPKDGTLWTLNACRTRRPVSELTAWADVGRSFHQPALFGTAVFGNPQASVRTRFGAQEKTLARSMDAGRAAALRNPVLAARFQEMSTEAKQTGDLIREASTRNTGMTAADWLQCRRAMDKLDRLAAALRRLGLRYQIWQKSIWGGISPTELPPAEASADVQRLEIVTVRTGYRAAGFLVTNFQDETLEARVHVSDLKTETGADTIPARAVTVRVAQFVEIRGGALVPDALPRLPESQVLTVPADRTRLVWLTAETRDTRPGRYEGTLTLKPVRRSMPIKEVKLRVTVLPIELDRNAGAVVPWNSGNACLNRASVHDLLAHGVNVIYVLLCSNELFPWCDAEGNVKKINTAAFDKIIENARTSRDCPTRLRFLLALAFDYSWYRTLWPRVPDAARLEFVSPAWKKAFATYLGMLRDHFGKHGIPPEDLIVYPYDEPVVTSKHDEVAEVVEVAKLIHEAEPRLKVFTNPPGMRHLATTELPRFDGYIDVYCPYIGRWGLPGEIEFYDRQLAKGREVWGYSIVGKPTPPLSAGYRAGHWRVFELGWTSFSGFWCYDSWKGDMWDDYDTVSGRGFDYAVVYTDRKDIVVPSRRWEAWREGVDDFRSLTLLRQLCEQAEGKDLDATKERKVLESAVESALGARDPNAVDRSRTRVMAAAAQLHARLQGSSLDQLLAPRTKDEFGQHLRTRSTLFLAHFNGQVPDPLKWRGQEPKYVEGVFPKLGKDNLAVMLDGGETPTNGIVGMARVPKHGTIDFWVRPAPKQPQRRPVLVRLGGAGNGKCVVHYDPKTRQVGLRVAGRKRGWTVRTKTALPTQQWTRVTASYAKDGCWLYLNGKLDAHQPYTAPEEEVKIWYSGPDMLYVGCWERYDPELRRGVPSAEWNFTGAVDELRILNYPTKPGDDCERN